jgi:predicted phosphodiesterase
MAKFAILSDIHGNIQALEVVLAKCEKLGVTKFISLGDIVGYNGNPAECLKAVRSLDPDPVIQILQDQDVRPLLH